MVLSATGSPSSGCEIANARIDFEFGVCQSGGHRDRTIRAAGQVRRMTFAVIGKSKPPAFRAGGLLFFCFLKQGRN